MSEPVPLLVLDAVMVESTFDGIILHAPVLQIDAGRRPDIAGLIKWLHSWGTTARAMWQGLNIDGELTVMLWVGPPSDVGQDFVVRIPLAKWRPSLEAAAASGLIGLSTEPLRFERSLLKGLWFYCRPPMEKLRQMLEATASGAGDDLK